MAHHPGDGDPTGAVLFSAAQAYRDHAAHLLRARFPQWRVEVLAPEVGRVQGQGVDPPAVAAACRGAPPVPFVRHLAAEDVAVAADQLDRLPAVAVDLAAPWGGDRVALQVWSSGQVARRAPDVRAEVDAALRRAGVGTVRGGAPVVVAVCLTPGGASAGVTRREDALADWPGGRIILGRSGEQVSRAEWKLEELAKVHPLPAPMGDGAGPTALDLGASPGGWTRILRSWGYEVRAVDPAPLDPSVAADPGVHHEVTTAGRFLAWAAAAASAPVGGDDSGGRHAGDDLGAYDIVVNDMRMEAERSCRVMVEAAPLLRPGGMAVVTLKVATRRPMATVERALTRLSRAYEVRFVRQLYHNRNEVTVVAAR